MNHFNDAVTVLLNSPNFAQLGTVNSNNTPHIDTVWFAFENNQLIVATTAATKKAKNLKTNPNAFAVITNKENPYEQAQISLRLAAIKQDDDLAICDQIAMRYTGRPFPQRQHKQRVVLIFDIVKLKCHTAKV
jgi:general stress protein 26